MQKQTRKDHLSEILSDNITGQLMSGLLYTHTRLNDNTKKILESTSFLYALIELLDEKGLLAIEELDKRKKKIAENLVKKFTESGVGLMYQEPEYDKYTFEHGAEMDCLSCLQKCTAICCKFPFALSRQDVKEGIVQWEFGRPYLIAHGNDGYCIHLDQQTYRCEVHENRPVPCRGFDCRNNEKWQVWLDHMNGKINPVINDQINQSNGEIYKINY